MAARKPDSEVGSLGVWAYDTARSLDLSAAQVAAATSVHEATIRKIEGGSNREPSRDLVYRMHRHFQEVAEQKGATAPPPPDGWLDRKPQPASDQSELIKAIDRNTAMLKDVLDAIVARLPLADPDVLAAVDALADAEREHARDRAGTSSPLPGPAQPESGEGRTPGTRTGGRA